MEIERIGKRRRKVERAREGVRDKERAASVNMLTENSVMPLCHSCHGICRILNRTTSCMKLQDQN